MDKIYALINLKICCIVLNLVKRLTQIRTVILFSFLLSIACNKTVHKKSEITGIEFATGNCFGPCQLTAIRIDSSLKYQFYGGWAPDPDPTVPIHRNFIKGYYNGRVSKPLWDSLTAHLRKINYRKLDTSYDHSADDQSLELIIHYDNKVAEKEHTINDYGTCDISSTESQFVIVFKPTTLNDRIFEDYQDGWSLSIDSSEMFQSDKYVLNCSKRGLFYPDRLQLICTTNLKRQDYSILTANIKENYRKPPITTKIILHKVN